MQVPPRPEFAPADADAFCEFCVYAADHVAMLVLTAGLTAAAVLAARCGLERGVRRTLAAAGVLIYVGSGLYFTLSPVEMNAQGHIKLEESLPIQACDLLALIAPMALIWRGRVLRAVAYFGAMGLTTQAFFTPVIDTGPETAKFWVFGCCTCRS